MKQIILSGGIGNQMFEYAFYLSCIKKGIKVKLNADLYKVDSMHNGFILPRVFHISEDTLTTSNSFSVLLTRLVCHYDHLGLAYSDKPMQYCGDAYHTKKKYYLGCYINSLYFDGINDEVIKAFRFHNIDQANMRLASEMQSVESVSLHIRRGDYLKNSIYGVCDSDYYRKAVDYMNHYVDFPNYYIFSDEPDWCEGFMRGFGVKYQIISLNRGEDSYKDMFLMTQCKHNIIANSTFSWWGAWLNQNKGKIIVSPDKWTTSIKMDDNPQNWMMIKV